MFETLVNYMECYCSEKDTYVAPYTSLITSSMMGKSRLLKQIANHTPLIYICLRHPRSTGYPKRSPRIVALASSRRKTLSQEKVQCRRTIRTFWRHSNFPSFSKPHLTNLPSQFPVENLRRYGRWFQLVVGLFCRAQRKFKVGKFLGECYRRS